MLDNSVIQIYDFFSHNVRTFTTEIVTTMECLKVGFIDTESEEFHIVYEASYLLDLYDTALNIVLKHLSGEDYGNKESIDVKGITEEFLKSISRSLSSNGLKIVKEYDNLTLFSDSFVFKNIYKIILYELIKLTSGSLKISLKERIEINSEKISDRYPEIFKLFGDILSNIGIKFTIGERNIIMEQIS